MSLNTDMRGGAIQSGRPVRWGSAPALVRVFCLAVLAISATTTVRGVFGPVWFPSESNLVRQARIAVSSSAGKPGAKYGPQSLHDENAQTWWATHRKRPLPQWVEATFDNAVTLDTVVLLLKENRLYANWKTVRLEFSDGTTRTESLADGEGPFLIRFPAVQTTSLRVVILEVHVLRNNCVLAELLAFHDPDRRVRVKTDVKRTWRDADITIAGRAEHPCVYVTPADIEQARHRVEQLDWARTIAQAHETIADKVVDRTPAWFRKHCPPKDAMFATGNTGCPICQARWGGWAKANCSFERPGTVKCANGHLLPDAQHPDDGTGYVAADGRRHYFIASYNAWVVETYQRWCRHLAHAYSLTGREAYATTCAAILDVLAEIYPHCTKGSVEYPSGHGRLARPGYQTARVLVVLVDVYDRIHAAPALDAPSVVAGLTRRANIEQNVLLNAGRYCYEKTLKGGLNNGIADYMRGVLTVGCLFGVDTYVDWAVDGPYGIRSLVANNVDRDGCYAETSLSYSNHTRNLYLTFAEPLLNYRSAKRPAGLNLYDEPRFRSFYVLPSLKMDCVGHWPRFGDCAPDTDRIAPPVRPFSPVDCAFAERIYARATDPKARQTFGELLQFFANGDSEALRARSNTKEWLLYHAAPLASERVDTPAVLSRSAQTVAFGQKGIAILRTPPGESAQACLLRFGPVLNHGHVDTLNLNYYGLGYELTYDLGYGWGNTHTQVGWAKQTASHNLVLVNETRQCSAPADLNGGSLLLHAGMPGMQVVDVEAAGVYASQGVTEYRRFLALVGTGPGSYLVDVFRVVGGRQHDYLLHALSDRVTFSGVQLGEPEPGSLAGPDVNWGERQMNDGFLSGVPHTSYWVAPPGNGLGFMMQPQRGIPGSAWQATWSLPSERDCLRLTMLPQAGTEVVTAWAPGIYPYRPRARYVIARRRAPADRPLRSTFVAVLEPYGAGLDTGILDGRALATRARSDDGEVRALQSRNVLFFKARDVGGAMHIALDWPQAGPAYLTVVPFHSPNYGTVEFLLDGKPLGPPFAAMRAELGAGKPLVYGPLTLVAGPHRLTCRIVAVTSGRPWVSIAGVKLAAAVPGRAASMAVPVLTKVQALPASEGVVALAVTERDGDVTRILYCPAAEGTRMQGGDVRAQATFACVSTRAGQVRRAHLIGKRLTVPGFRLELERVGFSGRVTAIDLDQHLVRVDAELPTDGRLFGQTVIFRSPRVARTVAYTVRGVRRVPGGAELSFGDQTLTLGKIVLDENPADDHTLTSLVPHDYTRNKFGNTAYFAGKLLVRPVDGLRTHVRSATYGQPSLITVDSTAGLVAGDTLLYVDVQPGDTFDIRNWASVEITTEGGVSVHATDNVEIETDGRVWSVPWHQRSD